MRIEEKKVYEESLKVLEEGRSELLRLAEDETADKPDNLQAQIDRLTRDIERHLNRLKSK